MFRRLSVLTTTVVSFAVLAACSGSESAAPRPTVPSSTSDTATATAAEIPEPPPVGEWTAASDPDSGIGFALPGEAKAGDRAGDPANGTVQYSLEVDGGLVMSVGISQAPEADNSAAGLDFLADSVIGQITGTGVEDVVTDKQSTTVGGRPALDYRVSFTARNGEKTIWFARLIGDGTRSVHLQSIAGTTPQAEASVTPVVEQYHRLLVDTVRLP